MKCPVCRDPDLVMTERQGIEIDYCPQCRGVWLDRGELDKIIERSGVAAAPAPQPGPPPREGDRYREGGRDRDDDDDYRRYGDQGGYPHKRRKGFLGELFDFD